MGDLQLGFSLFLVGGFPENDVHRLFLFYLGDAAEDQGRQGGSGGAGRSAGAEAPAESPGLGEPRVAGRHGCGGASSSQVLGGGWSLAQFVDHRRAVGAFQAGAEVGGIDIHSLIVAGGC